MIHQGSQAIQQHGVSLVGDEAGDPGAVVAIKPTDLAEQHLEVLLTDLATRLRLLRQRGPLQSQQLGHFDALGVDARQVPQPVVHLRHALLLLGLELVAQAALGLVARVLLGLVSLLGVVQVDGVDTLVDRGVKALAGFQSVFHDHRGRLLLP